MQEKTPVEIKRMMDSNPVIKLIDVREQWEFDKCHIENSTHIPMGKIPDSINCFVIVMNMLLSVTMELEAELLLFFLNKMV